MKQRAHALASRSRRKIAPLFRETRVNLLAAIDAALADRVREIETLRRSGRRAVGVLAAHAPPFELLEAAGAIPLRYLWGGTSAFETRGLRLLKNEACSLLKGIAGALASGEGVRPDAFVIGGACDQLRRFAEIVRRDLEIPVFELDLPRAHALPGSAGRLRDELDGLARELEAFPGLEPVVEETLASRIGAWNRSRESLARLAGQAARGMMGGAEALALARSVWVLGPERFVDLAARIEGSGGEGAAAGSSRALAFCGPPLLFGGERAAQLLGRERPWRLAFDLSETGFFPHGEPIEAGEDPLGALAERANRFPLACGFKRPDAAFLRALEGEGRPEAAGVVCGSLSFCAPWNHQMTRFRRRTGGRPFLGLEGDFADAQESRLKTRIGAFLESLSTIRKAHGSNFAS